MPPAATTILPRFETVALPARLWVPCSGELRVDIGATVRSGEALCRGTEAGGHCSVSPAAARVTGRSPVLLLNGREVPAITLDVDPTQPEEISADSSVTPTTVRQFLERSASDSLDHWIDKLSALGVWADRWTSPDLLGQLRRIGNRRIDTVVCNLLDPGPSLPVNRTAAILHGGEIVAALAALARMFNAKRVWIVVDQKLPAGTWSSLRQAATIAARHLRIVPVENDYPQPDPTLLLYTVTRRRLRPGQLPVDQSVFLLDSPAAAAVGGAMLFSEPMTRVPLVIHDRTRERSHLLSVPVGMKLSDVLAAVNMTRYGMEFRGGAPLREVRVGGDYVIAGGELAIYAVSREPDVNPDPCIRCGWCLEGCPVRINPAGILEAAQIEDTPLAERFGLRACIECGVCNYLCPSHLPLLQGVRLLRGERPAPADDDESWNTTP